MSPQERKTKVADLKILHEDYFQTTGDVDPLYIPKMAYRPKGKDEKYISFFPSELDKKEDIYTEFVSIDYDSEDLKRTLYLYKYNPHWKEEYELVTSSSGFERHLVPVNELKVIDKNAVIQSNKFTSSNDNANKLIKNPDDYNDMDKVLAKIGDLTIALNNINESIKSLNKN